MSKRGSRKKPISKKTASLLDQLARSQGRRDLNKRFLVVCEDVVSAPAYFKALKGFKKWTATFVKEVGSDGHTQPRQVVERAIELCERAKRPDAGTEPFGEIWCVLDGDYGSKIAEARSLASTHGIELAITTQCFEYWLLLHFVQSAKPVIKCSEHIAQLKESHVPDYDKGKCDYLQFVTNVDQACKWAEELRRPGIARGDLPENQNPCSEIYKLVQAIESSVVE